MPASSPATSTTTTSSPGFVVGYSKIHHDENRRIGYGVWFLREAVREDSAAADAIRDMLRTLLPSVAESLEPATVADGSAADLLGVNTDEIRNFALGGLTRQLDVVGVPLSSL